MKKEDIKMSTNFNWSNFDADFLKSILDSDNSKSFLRPTFETDEPFELASFVEGICAKPDRQFVFNYLSEINHEFLPKNPELVVSVFGTGKENPNALLRKIQARPLGEMMVSKYITALMRVGCSNDDYNQSSFTHPITIDLENTPYADVSLYDFQKDAISKLNEFATDGKHKSGLLVMPTGSGKTRTAVYFLLHDMVAQGYQVIWLTHRHMLIDQAAEQFKYMSSLISNANPKIKTFNFMCASGNHGTIKAASKKQNLMILSVQTATRNIDYIKKSLREKVIIVIDESHHSVAASYKRVVSAIRNRRSDALLLGLTATPIRYTDNGTAALQALFEQNIIYSIDMNTLITKEILAKPEFTTVETDIDFEPGITAEEARKIDRYGELPESVINRIAQSKRRNDIILEQYFKRDYGKTLIFALNIIHAQMLCDELKQRNVRCECVYSGKKDNDAIINAFKENKIDVLINVNILSEGSDVPNVETVFLTRPTQSESLLVQMIGRGMRGKAAGGTETVKIVDFTDKWSTFSHWLNPEFLFKYVAFEDEEAKETSRRDVTIIPWKDIRAVYRDLGSQSGFLSEKQSIPYGWFSLGNDEKPYTLLVFKSQIKGYVELFKQKEEIIENHELTAVKVRSHCFKDVAEKPGVRNIEALVEYLRDVQKQPRLFRFEHRDEIEPHKVALHIKENGANIFDVCNELFESYEDIILGLYGSLEKYRSVVFNILNYDETKEDIEPVEMPIELIPYEIDNSHDLEKLYEDVKAEMAEHLGDCAQDTGDIRWTDKAYGSYYGCYYYNSGDIEINCILNSSKVPEEVIKYLIYHEMLHRKYVRHDDDFRYMEHKYPNYTSYEKFLDVDFHDYKLVY